MTATAEPLRFARVGTGPRLPVPGERSVPRESWQDEVAGLLWFTLRRLTPPALVCHLAVSVRAGAVAVEPDLAVLRRELVGAPGQAVAPDAVVLAVDLSSPGCVSSPDHARYAAARLPRLWWVENHDGRPVVHAFAHDPETGAYAPHGVFRDAIETDRPFPMSFPLTEITPR